MDSSLSSTGLKNPSSQSSKSSSFTNLYNATEPTTITTVAEAMNAFYTYTATVTAAEIEASYLHEKYPDLDIDFSAIVKNANGFMSDTLSSGLYSKEFIETILPTYDVSVDDAKGSVTGATGLSLDGLEALLGNNKNLLGDIGLYAGLIGTGFLPLGGEGQPDWPEDIRGPKDTTPDTTPSGDTTPETQPSKTPGGCTNSGCSSSGCSSSILARTLKTSYCCAISQYTLVS